MYIHRHPEWHSFMRLVRMNYNLGNHQPWTDAAEAVNAHSRHIWVYDNANEALDDSHRHVRDKHIERLLKLAEKSPQEAWAGAFMRIYHSPERIVPTPANEPTPPPETPTGP